MSVQEHLEFLKKESEKIKDEKVRMRITEKATLMLARYDGEDRIVSSKDIESYLEDKPLPQPVKTNHESLDKIIRGFYPGQHIIFSAPPKSGKGQTLDTKILTENGYVELGSLSVGDEIIGSDGKNTKVLGIFPQGKKDIYEFTFSDGSTVKCDESHLWQVQSGNQRKSTGKHHVLSTIEIIDYMENNNNSLYIPLVKPVHFIPKGKLEVGPYTLGVLIGDGGFGSGITLMNTEKDILSKIPNIKPRKEKHHYGVIGMKVKIDQLGLGYKKSHEKFIPEEYKYASISDRRSILAGLIDTDGTVAIGSSGYGASYEYSTTSQQLAKDIQFIVQSLGGTAKISKRKGRYKKDGKYINARDNYRVMIRPADNDSYHLSEKHSLKWKPLRRGATRSIVSVEYAGVEETQCIKVSADDSLYVTENFIVTHNTSFILDLIDKMKESNPLLIPLEQSAEELISMMKERELEVPLFVTPRSSKRPTIEWITKRITESVLKYDSKVVFIDHFGYIKNESMQSQKHLEITDTMQELRSIAKQLDISIVSIVHVRKVNPTEPPTVEDLYGSAGYLQEADTIVMMWREAYKKGRETNWSNKVLLSVQANRRNGGTGSFRMKYENYKFIEDKTIEFEYEKDEGQGGFGAFD